MKRILLWPDTHVPDQHKRAIDNLLSYLSDYQPDELLLLGDFYDFKAVARWSKDTVEECGLRLQNEINEGVKLMTDIRSAFSGTARITLGNHEKRWDNYLSRYAKGVWGMDGLTIRSMGQFDKFDITPVAQPYSPAPGVNAIHGEMLGPTAGASAMKELKRHGRSIVQGHSHRLGIIHTASDRRRFAMECGHLFDQRKAHYLPFGLADWQMGFGLLTVDGQEVTPEIIPIANNGSFRVHGKAYGR